jgi:hypothetical protein
MARFGLGQRIVLTDIVQAVSGVLMPFTHHIGDKLIHLITQLGQILKHHSDMFPEIRPSNKEKERDYPAYQAVQPPMKTLCPFA